METGSVITYCLHTEKNGRADLQFNRFTDLTVRRLDGDQSDVEICFPDPFEKNEALALIFSRYHDIRLAS